MSGPKVVEEIKKYSLPRLNDFCENPEEKIKDLKRKVENPKPILFKKLDKETDIEFYEELLEQNLQFQLPNITFAGEMEFQGTKTKMVLKNVGRRHTEEDILAIFPNEKICFGG